MTTITNIEIPSTSNGPIVANPVMGQVSSARSYKTQRAPARPVPSGNFQSVSTNSAFSPLNENPWTNDHGNSRRLSPGPILPKPTVTSGANSMSTPTARRKTSSNSSSMRPLEEYTISPPDSIRSQGSSLTGCTADTSFGSMSAKSSIEDESRCGHKEGDDLHTWRLFPVPNSHALVAALSVIAYSIVFLFYAQRHRVILLVMTGFIAIFITILYAFGVLSLLYTMYHIARMEKETLEEPDSFQNPEGHTLSKRSASSGAFTSGEVPTTLSRNSTGSTCLTQISDINVETGPDTSRDSSPAKSETHIKSPKTNQAPMPPKEIRDHSSNIRGQSSKLSLQKMDEESECEFTRNIESSNFSKSQGHQPKSARYSPSKQRSTTRQASAGSDVEAENGHRTNICVGSMNGGRKCSIPEKSTVLEMKF